MKRVKLLAVLLLCISILPVQELYPNQWHQRADSLWNQAMASKKQKDYEAAINSLRQALKAERKSGNVRNSEVTSYLNELASLYREMGDYDRAVKHYQALADFSRKIQNNATLSDAYQGLGKTSYMEGSLDKAEKNYSLALEAEKKVARPGGETGILNQLALVSRKKGDIAGARSFYEKALGSDGGPMLGTTRAALLSNLGTLHYYTRDYARAMQYYERALEIDRKSGFDRYISSDYGNIGSLHMSMGQYESALKLLNRSLDMERKLKRDSNIALRLYGIGNLYAHRGDNARALDFYREAMQYNARAKNRRANSVIMSSMGRIYDDMGDFGRALEYYQKALTIDESLSSDEAIATRLTDIGVLFETYGRYDEALNFFSINLEQHEDTAKKSFLARDLRNIGRVLLYLKKYDRALVQLKRAAATDRAIQNYEGLKEDLLYCGMCCLEKGDKEGAVEYLGEAVDTIEGKTEKPALSKIDEEIFQWHIQACISTGQYDQALNSLFLRDATLYSWGGGSVSKKIKKGNHAKSGTFSANRAMLFFVNIDSDSPVLLYRDKEKTSSHEINKKKLVKDFLSTHGQKLVAAQEGGKDGKRGKKSLRGQHLRSDFRRIINTYYSLLSSKNPRADDLVLVRNFSSKLYDYFFSSVHGEIATKEYLDIRLDGTLRGFPVETLVMPDNSFMVEKFTIAHKSVNFSSFDKGKVYSDNGLLMWFRPWPGKSGKKIVFESQEERDHVRKGMIINITRGRNVKDDYLKYGAGHSINATGRDREKKTMSVLKINSSHKESRGSEKSFKKQFQSGNALNIRSLYLGCDLTAVQGFDESSALTMFPSGSREDGFLTIKEIESLNIRAGNVTISGCPHGRAADFSGRRSSSIAWALICSGAGGVTVPLWQVEENARLLFLSTLYQIIRDNNVDFSEALGMAKRKFIKGELEWSDHRGLYKNREDFDEVMKKISQPLYWASFIHYGG